MEKALLITYDLCGKSKNYDNLINSIKSNCSYWLNLMESCWVVITSDSCKSIRNTLSKFIDDDDRLFVCELEGTASWINVYCDSDLLKAKIESTVRK